MSHPPARAGDGHAAPRRARVVLGFLLAGALLAAVPAGLAIAQEEPPPPAAGEAVIHVEAPAEAKEGDELLAHVRIAGVEHMAAFDFTVVYGADKLRLERVDGMGELLEASGRNMNCGESPILAPGSVTVACFTQNPPVSLDGPPGAEGDGLLGTLVFTALEGGDSSLDFTKTTLVLDDIEPSGDPDGATVDIPHSSENAAVHIESAGGGFPWLIVVIAAGAAVVVVAGLAGYRLYRERRRSVAGIPTP